MDRGDADGPSATGPLVNFLTYRLARMVFSLNAQAVEVLAKTAGITLGQWRILSLVASGEAKTSRDLSRLFGFDPAFISRTVATMTKRGLIESARSKEDRRLLNLTATPKGVEIYDLTLPTMRRRQAHLLEALDENEQALIFGIVDKLEMAAECRSFEA